MKNNFLLLFVFSFLFTATFAQVPFTIEPTTVALYHFDEGSGSILSDVTGNGHTGSLSGATWTTGKFGGGLNFDGSNDYVNMGTSLNFTSTNFTIELWVNVADTTDGRLDIMSGLDPNNAGGYMLSYRNFVFQGYISSTNGPGTGLAQGGSAVQGQWHYVAMTYDGTATGEELKVYVDGLVVDTGSTGYPNSLPLALKLGAGGNLAGYKYFNGQLDEMRFSNVAKTACEIFSYYNNSTPPVASFTSSANAVCDSTAITFTNTGTGSSIEWFNNGVSFGTGGTEVYTMTGAGTHSINLVTTDGVCVDSLQTSITVNAIPAVVASGTATICVGDSAILSASGASSYTWNNSAGTGASVMVQPTTTTTYIVTGTDVNSCTNTDQVTITVNSLPTVSASGATTLCEGESATLTASGADTYDWDNGAGTGSSVTVSPVATTTYTVVGTDVNGCENSDQVTVAVTALPNVAVTLQGITLTATNVNSGVTYQWLDCNNNFVGLGGQTNQSFTAGVDGTYAVKITENGCVDTSACFNVVGVGVHERDLSSQVSIYPVPASELLTVELGQDLNRVSIEILDMTGKVLVSKSYESAQLTSFDVSKFEDGFYVIQVRSEASTANIKFVIKK